ncbi:MAG: dihydrodipicolinate synthase family protein [Candidatus Asgardarchaeia archaeon]
MKRKEFKGIITALVTPFKKDGSLNEDGLRELVEFQIEHGVHGFFPCGTMSEGMIMPLEMRKRVIEVVVDQTNGRIPVIAHVGFPDTESTVKLAKFAEDVGADALGAIGPYFYHPDIIGLVRHFKELKDSVEIPVLVYNNPGRMGYNITPSYFEKLVDEAGVDGIKDTSKNIAQLQSLVRLFGERCVVIGASDSLIYATFVVGAVGHISGVSNPFPELAVRIYELVKKGMYEEALKAQLELDKVLEILKSGPYITPYKEALKLRGIDTGFVRSPLREMTDEEKKFLKNKLEELGLI